jgi:hypothetical protein
MAANRECHKGDKSEKGQRFLRLFTFMMAEVAGSNVITNFEPFNIGFLLCSFGGFEFYELSV